MPPFQIPPRTPPGTSPDQNLPTNDDGSLQVRDGASITYNSENEDDPAAIAAMLKPDSELHGTVLGDLLRFLELSYRNTAKRFPDWDRVNQHLTMYVDLDAQARLGNRQSDPELKENPEKRSVTVPISYAIYKIILTELFSVFASRIPFLSMKGRSPEDESTAPNMEALLDYDHMASNMSLAIYSMLGDMIRYGQGTVFDHWEDITEIKDISEQNPLSKLMVMMGVMPAASLKGPVTVREYNNVSPVDPYMWWRDPRVSISDLQQGDFCGHRVFKSWNYIKAKDMAKQRGPYFNVDTLKDMAGAQQATREVGGKTTGTAIVERTRFADDIFALKSTGTNKDRGYFALDHLQVRIVPKEWKLGSGEDPVIWWFTVADEKRIIRAHPSPFEHDQFSYSACEIDPDPHAMFNSGLIENLDGLQRLINWFVNSHVANVRKIINNEMIWSPRFFDAESFLKTGSARWIKMTKELADAIQNGRRIEEFYGQLQVADVTSGHLKLVEFFMEMVNRLSGATDPMAGVPTDTQKTLGEIQLLTQGASKRNGVTAEMVDIMAISPLAYRLTSNRQQYTSITQYMRILGSDAFDPDAIDPATGRPQLKPISKDDISGEYDYIPQSNLGPGDPRRTAATWMQILQSYGEYPVLMQPDQRGRIPDIPKMFKEGIVRNLGVRDIDSFYRLPPPPTIPPGVVVGADGQLQAAAQAGNAVPIPEPVAGFPGAAPA